MQFTYTSGLEENVMYFIREYISLIDDDLEDDDDDIQLQDALVSSWKDEPSRCAIVSIFLYMLCIVIITQGF